MPEKTKAVFLDRDGTISVEVGYIDSSEKLELYAGAEEALTKMQRLGFKLIIITNQSGVARGYFPESKVEEINNRLIGILSDSGVTIDGVYYCPHYPGADVEKYDRKCDCRKPGIKLVMDAVEQHNIELEGSVFIGDKLSDIECGKNAGIRTILVRTGYGADEEKKITTDNNLRMPDFIANDLEDSVAWIKTL